MHYVPEKKKKKNEGRQGKDDMPERDATLKDASRRDTEVDALANLSKTYLSISFPLKVQGFNLQIRIFSRYFTGIINESHKSFEC